VGRRCELLPAVVVSLPEVDTFIAHRNLLLEQELALPLSHGQRTVGANHSVPRQPCVGRGQHPADSARRATIDISVGADVTNRDRAYTGDDLKGFRAGLCSAACRCAHMPKATCNRGAASRCRTSLRAGTARFSRRCSCFRGRGCCGPASANVGDDDLDGLLDVLFVVMAARHREAAAAGGHRPGAAGPVAPLDDC
jgi:hypothetical protein